jgi:Carboxypeptidase regulatory-like domain
MVSFLLILLATALSEVDTRVHLDSEGWIVDAKSPAAQSQWQWSARCAPRKMRAGEPFTCGASRELGISVVDLKGRAVRNATVLWATEDMLRDLPDRYLPTATTTDEGLASIAAASTEDLWIRVAGPDVGTYWKRLRCDESELRLSATPIVPLRLRVRGDDDKPVSRARVALLPSNCTTICPERLLAFDVDPETPRLLGVAGSSYKLVAWSDSHAPMTRTVAFSSPSDLTLHFERGGAVTARIVDLERKPLANGRMDVHFQLPALRQAIRRTVIASADGTVRLTGLPAASIEWAASATGAGRRTDHLPLTVAGADLGEIMLQPARRATVRVVDGANVPVVEAKIVARGSGYVMTDEKGAAIFQELPVDDVSLDVTAEGFLPARVIAGKEEADVRVRMERGAGIRAVLLRESDSQPPQSVRVRITNNGTESLRTFDVERGLTISGLRTGSARLRISGDGIEPYDSGALTVTEGDLRDLGIVMLKSGASIRGIVADAAGAPIRDARIRALHIEGDVPALAHVLGNWSEVTSGEDGAFRMSGLTRGSQFLAIEAPGFAQRAIANLTIEGSGTTLDLGTIELTRGTRVELVCRPAAQCGSEASVLTAGPEFPFAAIHTLLENGRGSFEAVPSGHATLRLTRAKHVVHERSIELGHAESTTIEIDLPSLKLRGEVVLGTERADEGSLLFTRAVRSTGVPIMTSSQTPQGSTMGTEWLGTFGASTFVTVARGTFAVDGIAPGQYDVVFRTGASATAPVRLELPDIGEHNLRLQFEDREIAGTIRDAEERPALARVEVVDGTGATHITNSGLDGQFRLLGLGAGRATIRATASGRKAEMAIDPSSQSARNLILRLTDEDRRGFAVTVRESRGQPAAGVLVFLTERGGLRAASTDNEGRAVFRAVDENGGSCAVAVHRLGGEWAFGTVRAGSPSNIVLPERGGTVVAQADGIAGAAFITTPDGFPLDRVLPMVGISTQLGSAGSLRLAGLPAGTYSVRMGMSQKVAMVSAGETTLVRFDP